MDLFPNADERHRRVRALVNSPPVTAALRGTYDQMSVYRVAHAAGFWDCDDVLYCECGGPHWHVNYTPAEDGELIRNVIRHASLCPHAAHSRALTDPETALRRETAP